MTGVFDPSTLVEHAYQQYMTEQKVADIRALFGTVEQKLRRSVPGHAPHIPGSHSGERHVASQEGVDKYHLPMGALIKPGAPEFGVNQVTVHHPDAPGDRTRAVVARGGPTKIQATIHESPSAANQAITDILNNNPQLGHVFHQIRGRRFIHQDNGDVHAQMKSGAFEKVGSIDATSKGIVARPSAKFAKRTGMNPSASNYGDMRGALEHFVSHVPGEKQSDRDHFRVTQNLRDVLTSKDNAHMRSPKAAESHSPDGQPIPPGWTQVEVAKDAQWAVQARGRDAQGNVVRLPSQASIQAGLVAKRARTQALHDNMPHLDQALGHADLATDDTAAVVYLMRHSGARVDSSGGKSTRIGSHGHQAFGATSIQARHVNVTGSHVKLSFIGKAGKLNRYEITDKRFADAMRTRVAGKDPNDPVFDTNDAKTAAFIRKNLNVTTNRPNHDMRSYFATSSAADLIAQMPESDLPTSERDYAAKQKPIVHLVATMINDSDTVARGTYIDPMVWTGLRRNMTNPDPKVVVKPLTNEQYQQHVAKVEDLLKQAVADGKETNVEFKHDGVWDPEREAMHRDIVNSMFEQRTKTAKQDGIMIVTGGLMGSGKSTTLQNTVNVKDYIEIDADDVKEEMAKRGMIPDIEGLSPMESAGLIHAESAEIAHTLLGRAESEKYNIIHDTTMRTTQIMDWLLDEAKQYDYKDVRALFMDIPVETSVERAISRHRKGMEAYRQGNGPGGRYVPPAVIRESAVPGASSLNKQNFDALKKRFTSWSMYDNSVSGQAAKLIDKSKGK